MAFTGDTSAGFLEALSHHEGGAGPARGAAASAAVGGGELGEGGDAGEQAAGDAGAAQAISPDQPSLPVAETSTSSASAPSGGRPPSALLDDVLKAKVRASPNAPVSSTPCVTALPCVLHALRNCPPLTCALP